MGLLRLSALLLLACLLATRGGALRAHPRRGGLRLGWPRTRLGATSKGFGGGSSTSNNSGSGNSKGFGSSGSASKSGGGKSGTTAVARPGSWQCPKDAALEAALKEIDPAGGLRAFLNPKLFEDPSTLEQIKCKLQSGHVVVLRDAFRPEFAEATHRELAHKSAPWSLNEEYFPDGYSYHHHNIFDRSLFSPRLTATADVFAHESSKVFLSDLSGRDCSGPVTGAPSYYKPGDHSLPHTDWAGQRTVAYIWHLSKDWLAEWGGALYWCPYDHATATLPASFNTLVLFSVTTKSSHFVTTVSPHASTQRLTFNGWYQSAWVPSAADDFDSRLSTPELRQSVTHTQLQAMSDILSDKWVKFAPGKRERLLELKEQTMLEFFPRPL